MALIEYLSKLCNVSSNYVIEDLNKAQKERQREFYDKLAKEIIPQYSPEAIDN